MKKEYARKAMLCRNRSGNVVDPSRVPAEVDSEREARMRLNHRSLTAELLGDPLPGYSALDRKSVGA